MKFKAVFFSLLFFGAIMLSSCGASSKACPAYGNVEVEETVEVNS